MENHAWDEIHNDKGLIMWICSDCSLKKYFWYALGEFSYTVNGRAMSDCNDLTCDEILMEAILE